MIKSMSTQAEIDALGHSIAYDSCCSLIESSCLIERDQVEASWDDAWFHSLSVDSDAEDAVVEAIRYLDARGLLLRHPDRPDLVQVLDESEPGVVGEGERK